MGYLIGIKCNWKARTGQFLFILCRFRFGSLLKEDPLFWYLAQVPTGWLALLVSWSITRPLLPSSSYATNASVSICRLTHWYPRYT